MTARRFFPVGVAALAAALPFLTPARGRSSPIRPRGRAAQARLLSRHAVPASSAWKAYDQAPARALLHPVRVLRVIGDVEDPQALAHAPSGKATTLTYPSGGPPPSLVLDYGRDVGGLPMFDIKATSGATLSATYSEPLYNLGNDGSIIVALFLSGATLRTDTFAPTRPGVVASSLIQGGERYERLTVTSPGSVTLRSVGIRFWPLRETPSRMRGRFLSSDRLLNRIWYAGAYTLNLNQVTPGTPVWHGTTARLRLILDGAKRDRAVWSGDHVISDLTDYYVSDPRYARDSLALFLEHPATAASNLGPASGSLSVPGPLPGACSPNPPAYRCFTWSATYSMLVMPALYNYYLYTGDLGFVRRHWRAVLRQMRWDAEQVGSDGLFAVNSVDDSDWNIEMISGELTYVNAVYVQALRSAAQLALALGQARQGTAWRASAFAVSRAVNAKLWNRGTRLYDASASVRGSVVQDANVTAVLAGIPSRARARRIMDRLQSRLRSRFGPPTVTSPTPPGYNRWVSPYMGSFQVLADFATGNETAALANVRQEWGYMIAHDPGGVLWERIQLDGRLHPGGIADSAAHAWSTGPTTALSQYVLGVRPVEPGYRSWAIAPEPAKLSWAQGVVPTPHGPISVRWLRGTRNQFFKLTVITPRGTSGTVLVPVLRRSRVIAMDGRIVWAERSARGGARARLAGRAVAFSGLAGKHTFAWVS